MTKIIQNGSKELRCKSKVVLKERFETKELNKILDNMSQALESQADGVALAAPQIGINLRIFIISWKVFANQDEPLTNNLSKEEIEGFKMKYEDKVFINPKIVKTSKDTRWMDEGCLSVRPFFGEVRRATKCRVRAYDKEGVVFEFGGAGLFSQIFQHEIDHLDGVLFIDKARNLREVK